MACVFAFCPHLPMIFVLLPLVWKCLPIFHRIPLAHPVGPVSHWLALPSSSDLDAYHLSIWHMLPEFSGGTGQLWDHSSLTHLLGVASDPGFGHKSDMVSSATLTVGFCCLSVTCPKLGVWASALAAGALCPFVLDFVCQVALRFYAR